MRTLPSPVTNHRDEADVVERPCEGFVVRKILNRGRRRALALDRWAETGGDRKVPSFRAMSFWESNHRPVGQGWPAVESRRSSGGADLPSLSEVGGPLSGQLRRRRGPPRCVGGYDLHHKNRLRHGRRNDRGLGRTRGHCVSWSRNGMRRRRWKAVRVRSASQSVRGRSGPLEWLAASRQRMRVEQVGQAALAPRRAVWTPSAADTSASCVSLKAAQRLLQTVAVLLLEAKKAAGEWRTGSLVPNPPFLMEAWARSQASWTMATWMIPPRQLWREVCILWAQK